MIWPQHLNEWRRVWNHLLAQKQWNADWELMIVGINQVQFIRIASQSLDFFFGKMASKIEGRGVVTASPTIEGLSICCSGVDDRGRG
ncbi:hypothetical protein L6452_40259 [Arctium lappa]|uniref:Uncharacterized protein n=1 Tax=Arctium lappa TaxID=4217 RepID=A0ACB8XMM0_ARCLA|nr:hypothetical protein L6452_40259 [Arctium lappa]